MDRRDFGKWMFAGLAGAASLKLLGPSAFAAVAVTPVAKTDAEWKKLLTPEQYHILREEGTEHAYSSPNNDEHRKGMFACVACDLPLFDSATKFDSHTGWPSFYDHLPNALAMKKDFALLMPRTEYHCARCGGHHGHVFNDGPAPTGLRHCNNGAVLKFIPAAA